MRVVLFDIDGTLITTRGAGREAFAHAFSEVLALPLDEAITAIDRVDFRGGTDEVLIDRVAASIGVDLPRLHGPFVAAYLRVLERTMTHGRISIQNGVPELLAALQQQGDVVLGLLTGNIREGARRKLQPVGLDHLLDGPGGFGDDARHRPDIARAAARRVADHGGDPKRVLVIGDTQHDVSAAQAIGAWTVAVASGGTDRPVLEAARADLVLDDLGNFKPVLDLLAEMAS